MAHTLWRTFYHIVFVTKERAPLLSPPLRVAARRLLWQKADRLRCVVHAIHVQPDHAHLVLSIPPSQAAATVIGQLKGGSSFGLAKDRLSLSGPVWGDGYALHTFGERNLPDVVAYVQDQDRRHADKNLISPLEPASGPFPSHAPIPDPRSPTPP